MAGPGARVKLTGMACVAHRADRLQPSTASVLPGFSQGPAWA